MPLEEMGQFSSKSGCFSFFFQNNMITKILPGYGTIEWRNFCVALITKKRKRCSLPFFDLAINTAFAVLKSRRGSR